MTDLTAQIIARFHTRSEALSFLRDFNGAGNDLFFSEETHRASEKKVSDQRHQQQENEDRFGEKLWKLVSRHNFKENIEQSEKEIKEMPVLTVYLALELQGPQLELLSSELVSNFSKSQFLIDFKLDPGLVAGCAMVWEGKYGDFSVKRLLEQNNGEIRKLIVN